MTSKTEVPQTLVGPLLQRFFMEHLCNHKRLSPQTVKSYRDTFRLLLQYLQAKSGQGALGFVDRRFRRSGDLKLSGESGTAPTQSGAVSERPSYSAPVI